MAQAPQSPGGNDNFIRRIVTDPKNVPDVTPALFTRMSKPPKFSDRRRNRGLPARVVCHVEGNEGCLGAAFRERLCGLPTNVSQHVANHHGGACFGEGR